MTYVISNILDEIERDAENLDVDISRFSSPNNDDIDFFLKNNAIQFSKLRTSITYLVSDTEDGSILGYFTLTHKALSFSAFGMSNSRLRKLNRYSKLDEKTGKYTTSAFLIAQLGKNYAITDGSRISGTDLMQCSIDVLEKIQRLIGGGVVYLEAEDNSFLRHFYEDEAGFRRFGERIDTDGTRFILYMRLL